MVSDKVIHKQFQTDNTAGKKDFSKFQAVFFFESVHQYDIMGVSEESMPVCSANDE